MKFASAIVLAFAVVLPAVSICPCAADTVRMKDGTTHNGKIMVETGSLVIIQAIVTKDGKTKKVIVRLERKDVKEIVTDDAKPPDKSIKPARPKPGDPTIKKPTRKPRRPVKVKRPAVRLPTGQFNLRRIRRSVVLVRNIIHNRTYAIGSGFVVREDGVVYTNRHVVEAPSTIKESPTLLVGVPSRGNPDILDYFHAKVALVAPESSGLDFAVLKITAKEGYGAFPVIKISATGGGLGQPVAALGYPDNLGESPTLSFTKGSVSSANVRWREKSYFQTDAAVNPGNSGGPMVNAAGHAIGLVTMRMSRADNMAYALHLTEVSAKAKSALARTSSLKPKPGPVDKKDLAKIDTMMGPENAQKGADGWVLEAGRQSEYRNLLRVDAEGLDYWVTSEKTLPENFRLHISCWVTFRPGYSQAVDERTIRLLCVRFGAEDTTLPVRSRNGWTVWSNHKTTAFYKDGKIVASKDTGNSGWPMELTIAREGEKFTVSAGAENILEYAGNKLPKGRRRFSIGGYQSRLVIAGVSVTDLSDKPRTLPEDLEGLTKALGSDDWTMRNDAVVALGRLGTESIPALLQAASDKHTSVRERAVDYLGKLAAEDKGKSHAPAVLKVVKIAINDKSVEVRRSGLRAVMHLKSAAEGLAADVVKAANIKPKPDRASTRAVAFDAIKSLGPACLPELVKAICRRDPISEIARGIIKGMADRAVPAIIEAFKDAEKDARIDLIRILQPRAAIDKRVSDLMETVLKSDEDWQVRQAAVMYLGTAKIDRIGALVIIALKDEHPDVQKAATNILLVKVRAGDDKAAMALTGIATGHAEWKTRQSVIAELIKRDSQSFVPIILKALGDKNSKIRMMAVQWLARRADLTKDSIPALTAVLNDEYDSVRYSAVSALSRIKSPEVIDALAKVLKDPTPSRAKPVAARALCKHGDRGLTVILAVARDPDSPGRETALRAMRTLDPLPPDAVAVFLELLESKTASMRQLGLGALMQVKSPSEKLVKAFLARVSDTDRGTAKMAVTAVNKCGSAAVPGLIDLLASESLKVRGTAVKCLANMGGKLASSVPALREAYSKETDMKLRADIIGLFNGIDTNAAIEVLHTALLDKSKHVSDVAMGILKGTGEPLIPVLAKLLASDDEETRHKGVRLLNQLGSAKAMSTLETALDDKALKVRVAAAILLVRKNRLAEKLAGPLAEGLASKDGSMARDSESLLKKLKDHAVGVLAEMMESSDAELADKALGILGEIKTEKALDAVKTALTHKTPAMRARAAWIIASTEGPTEELAPYVIEYAIISKGQHQRQLSRVLLKLKDGAIPHLSKALKNPDEGARLTVLRLLREFYAYESVIPVLEEASKDKSKTIRDSARRYLGRAREYQKRRKKNQ